MASKSNSAQGIVGALSPLLNKIAGVSGVGGSTGGALAALGPVGAIAEKLTGGFTSLLSVSQDLLNVILPMVAAFNPALIEQFNLVVNDLMATIGSGFAPAIEVAISVVKEMAGILLPTIQQLTPIITQFSNILGDAVTSSLRLLVSVVELLIPLLQIAVDLFGAYTKVLNTARDILTALVRTVSALIGSFLGGLDIGSLIDRFAKFLQDAIVQVVKFAATLAALAGFTDFITDFANQLEKLAKEEEKRAEGLKAAAKNAQTGDIQALLKKAQENAFIARGAVGGAREGPDTGYLRDLSRDLKGIVAQNNTLQKIITDGADAALRVALGPFYEYIKAVPKVVKNIKDSPAGQLGKAALSGIIGVNL